jgi:hypothetical protein
MLRSRRFGLQHLHRHAGEPRAPPPSPLNELLVVYLTVVLLAYSVLSQVSELEGHVGDVTSVVVVAPPPTAATAAAKLVSNCWTAGLDGVLIYWDFVAAEALRKVRVGLPVHSMVLCSSCFLNFAV